MKKRSLVVAVTFAIAGAMAFGYAVGDGQWPFSAPASMAEGGTMKSSDSVPQASGRILYWKDPDGKPTYAASPTKTADGRDYLAVYEKDEPDLPGAIMAAAETPKKKAENKIKFYRNPMGLPDTSPTPKKDSMGMDYIPVYEDEDGDDGSSVKVSLDKIQRAGVKSEAAEMRFLAQPVRAPGVAKIDERTLREVTLRADAYIEKLYVAELGKHVKVGDPLFRVYSPDIVKAEVDYKIAKGATAGQSRSDAQRDLQGAVIRLQNLDVPASVIKSLEANNKETPMKIDWPSPVSGVVIKKEVVEGQKVSAGAMLYQIADLSKIWVIADVAEQDIGPIKVDAPAKVVFRAFPEETFEGKVSFILHELDMQTRTAKVRIEIANPEHRIRHDMYADVSIDAGQGDGKRLSVPISSVLDTGAKQVVLVEKGEGRFEPRPVKLGARGDGYVEIKEGLAEGDKVVTSANFLIDAESNLKAALKGFTAGSAGDAKPPEPMPQSMTEPMSPANGTAEAKP